MAQCECEEKLQVFFVNNSKQETCNYQNALVLCENCISHLKDKMPEKTRVSLLTESMALFRAGNKCQCLGWCGKH